MMPFRVLRRVPALVPCLFRGKTKEPECLDFGVPPVKCIIKTLVKLYTTPVIFNQCFNSIMNIGV